MSATKTGNVTKLKHVLFATGVWEGEATLPQRAATLPPQPTVRTRRISLLGMRYRRMRKISRHVASCY
jgi:hypothetical protein